MLLRSPVPIRVQVRSRVGKRAQNGKGWAHDMLGVDVCSRTAAMLTHREWRAPGAGSGTRLSGMAAVGV